MLADFHVHTAFCDGRDTPEEMIRAAIDLGMSHIGFSAHTYVPFDEEFCITRGDERRYIDTLTDLRLKYRHKITIYIGMEHDYYSKYPTLPLDYVISSAHYFKCGEEYFAVDGTPEILDRGVAKHFGGDYLAAAEEYFRMVAATAAIPAAFTGHIDLISKFNRGGARFSETHPRYLAAAFLAVDALIPTGRPFEINTGAISRGWRDIPYPAPDILRYIKKQGGRILLSGDSHRADTLCYRFEEAKAYARDCGFDL